MARTVHFDDNIIIIEFDKDEIINNNVKKNRLRGLFNSFLKFLKLK